MFSHLKPKNHWRAIGFLALALVVGLAATTVPGLAKDEVKLTFSAFAVNMSNIAPGTSTQVEIDISRWSTEAEHDELFKVLVDQGDKKLVDALRKAKRDRVGAFGRHGGGRDERRVSEHAHALFQKRGTGQQERHRLDHRLSHWF